MCLPVAAAIPLMIASTAVSAAGQVMQGAQAQAQGKYEAAVNKQNQGLEVDAYQQTRLNSVDERTAFWRKVAQVQGQQIASMAANGIDVGFGSAQRVQDATQMLAQDDAARLYKHEAADAKGHLINASNYAEAGKAAIAKGDNAFVNGLFGAATTVLGGLSQASGMKAKIAPGK